VPKPGTSCLGIDAERPGPGGTVDVIVSPTDFVVETELMPLQKRQVLLLKSSGPMMFDLILDAINGFCQLRDADTESAITLLPANYFR
jgi:hypothetical protein